MTFLKIQILWELMSYHRLVRTTEITDEHVVGFGAFTGFVDNKKNVELTISCS